MLEPQNLPPFDPYRTLQLHAHAPHELVVEAYWALIGRERRRLTVDPEAGARIAELNRAYSLLLNGGDRAAYDEEQGVGEQPVPDVHVTTRHYGLLGFGSTLTMVSDHADFYHLLRIDRDAGPEIVDAAYSFLARRAIGHEVQDVFLRDLLDEAHDTLSNPKRRAQYDAALLANAAYPSAEEFTAGTSFGAETFSSTGGQQPPAPEDPGAAPAANAPLRQAWGGLLRRVRRAGGDRGAAPAPSIEDFENEQIIRAEQLRLLTLRDAQNAAAAGASSAAASAQALTLGELVFIDGPREGEHVSLGAAAMTIGASDASGADLHDTGEFTDAEHASMRLRGDIFIVRRVDGVDTVIARQRLALPVAMLHDGDEIRIGLHHLRLTKPAFAPGIGAASPNGTPAPDGATAPSGANASNGTQAPVGAGAPNGMQAPVGADAPNGTQAPVGADAPNGTQAPVGTDAPNGAQANGAQPSRGARRPDGTLRPHR